MARQWFWIKSNSKSMPESANREIILNRIRLGINGWGKRWVAMEMNKCWPMIWGIMLNEKDEAKGQRDDKTKIYNGYIRLIGFSTAAMSLVLPLRVSSNRIAATKTPRANRIAATKTPRANRLQLAPIFFLSQPLSFKPFTPWYYIQGTMPFTPWYYIQGTWDGRTSRNPWMKASGSVWLTLSGLAWRCARRILELTRNRIVFGSSPDRNMK